MSYSPNTIMEPIRHGDVVLVPVESLPEGNSVKHNGELILALGEVTGHRHVLKCAPDTKAVEVDGVIFMTLTIPAPLTHEEHHTIDVPAGTYKRLIKRTYDYALESIASVKD